MQSRDDISELISDGMPVYCSTFFDRQTVSSEICQIDTCICINGTLGLNIISILLGNLSHPFLRNRGFKRQK